MSFRTCQIEALQACDEHDVGIVRMSCGSGKTKIEIELCLQERISCLIAPRNALLKQHITEFKKHVKYVDKSSDIFEYSFETKKFQLITINCENDLKMFHDKSKQVCFIINNMSLCKLPVKPDILIVDEAHTHKKAILNSKMLKNVQRKYFFTATPQDMDDVLFYGETIYTYDYRQALQDNYVTPFKIVPIWKRENFHKELQEKMDARNLTHCIHYYENVNGNENNKNLALSEVPMKKLKNSLKITDKTQNRDEIFNKFVNKGGHLLSCKTISYGIDIPKCDSVFLSYISNSVPDNVQKMMRAIRLNKCKPDKIAYIFVLMDIPEPEQTLDEDGVDITESVKELQQQLIFRITVILKEGLNINIIPEKLVKNENSSSESSSNFDENEINDSDTCCDSETSSENEINDSESENKCNIKFTDVFDDHTLEVWYIKGEIHSKISFNDNRYNETYELLKNFVEINNKLPSKHSENQDEKSLGDWCSTQRSNYKNNTLNEEKINQLASIPGWYWDINDKKDDEWNEIYESCKKFVEINSKLPSYHSKNQEVKKLYRWYNDQRTYYKTNKLTQEKINKLKNINGWKWNVFEENWNAKYKSVKNFIEINSKFPSKESKNQEEKTLGQWCSCQRKDYKNNLSSEKINQLEIIPGWKWNIFEETWNAKYESLKNFVEINSKFPPQHSEDQEEKTLGSWCSKQRNDYKNNKLSEEKINQLKSISGWFWNGNEEKNDQWNKSYELVKEFVKKNSKIPSDKAKAQEEKSLGIWCSNKRKDYKNNKLSEEKINQLASISGWYWSKDEKEVKPEVNSEEVNDKYEEMTKEQLIERLKKQEQRGVYNAPNGVEKDEINKLFSENIDESILGDIIVLDDIEFKSAKMLNKSGVIIPNNSERSGEMRRDKKWGQCVRECSLEELLNEYIKSKKPIKGIYADLMGALSSESKVLEQISRCNLTANCVVGFTVCARSNIGAVYTNDYATKLVDLMYSTFDKCKNLVEDKVYVYGVNMRMATSVFVVNCYRNKYKK